MFENIIGQDRATSLLREELAAGTLPRAILIHGEQYAGKLSTALEVVRILSCTGDASWTCGCRSCALHRVLAHPGTLLLGSRSFGAEIAASADTLRRLRNTASRYLYVRAARKLLRRCDAHLWEGADARMRSAFAVAAELEEGLQALEPGRPLPEGEALESLLERLGEKAHAVAAALPRDNTPISVIRRAAAWAHLSSTDRGRAIVVENADRMVEASRNSLLKLLEEPPEGVYIVLLTTNVRAVIPTILSRTRRYRLEPRDERSSREVLARVFRAEAGSFSSLAAFFLSWERAPADKTGGLAELYLRAAASELLDERPVLALYDKSQKESALEPGEFFREFARALVERMRAGWREGGGPIAPVEAWNRIVQEAAAEQDALGLQPALVLQSTLYRMRDAAA